MTITVAERQEKGRRRAPASSLAGDLAGAFLAAAAASSVLSWPSPRYQPDPVAFAHDVLGIDLWSEQARIARALARPRARVSVRSGRRCGKSLLGASLSLWFFCSFPGARVRLTAPTTRQVEDIVWREVKMAHERAGRCAECAVRDPGGFSRCVACRGVRPIPEQPAVRSYTGLRNRLDFRELLGFTAKEGVDAQGTAGAHVLYVVDEASGVEDDIFDAINGNCAGGDARVLLISNPTRHEGYFFDTHDVKRAGWETFALSSEKTPNVLSGEMLIPGLAERAWIEERRAEWGADSPMYQIHVLGEFVKSATDRVIPATLLTEAESRWPEIDVDLTQRLDLGLDVARFGDDDSAGAARRGKKILEIATWHGLDERTLAASFMQLVRRHRRPREQKAVVRIDICGTIGPKVYAELLAYGDEIEVVPVNASERPTRPREFRILRDQLWFAFRQWLLEGGAVPSDVKFAAEATSPKVEYDALNRVMVESKDEIRKRLKRSPDRADAAILSVWEPGIYDHNDHGIDEAPEPEQHDDAYAGAIDSYSGADVFWGAR